MILDIFIRIILTIDELREMNILIILNLPLHEYEISLHFIKTIFQQNFVGFSLNFILK